MAVKERIFGTDATGRTAHLFTLTNRAGVSATFTDLGAAWVGMELPAEGGKTVDVILGYDDPAIYERNPGCLGAIVGRHANRIAGAGFTLDGRRCQLEKNQGENNLHSGPDGWWKRLFRAEVLEEENAVRFSIEETDGSQGFPGALSFSVTYGLTEENAVEIHYAGTLTAGAAHTVFNPTNHAYFNLAGHDAGEIDAQEVWIHADYFTPTDAVSIPTGELREVAGTAFDFRQRKSSCYSATGTTITLSSRTTTAWCAWSRKPAIRRAAEPSRSTPTARDSSSIRQTGSARARRSARKGRSTESAAATALRPSVFRMRCITRTGYSLSFRQR